MCLGEGSGWGGGRWKIHPWSCSSPCLAYICWPSTKKNPTHRKSPRLCQNLGREEEEIFTDQTRREGTFSFLFISQLHAAAGWRGTRVAFFAAPPPNTRHTRRACFGGAHTDTRRPTHLSSFQAISSDWTHLHHTPLHHSDATDDNESIVGSLKPIPPTCPFRLF